MRKAFVVALTVGADKATLAGPASGPTPKVHLFLDGQVVGTQ